jgi:hypothetical protein
LAENEWLAGEFSIADIANWCWCRIHNWAGAAVGDLPNLQRWMAALEQRPSCAKGIRVLHETNCNEPDEDSVGTFVTGVRSILVIRYGAMAKAIHSMIRVLDFARSIDFYERALGLKVY